MKELDQGKKDFKDVAKREKLVKNTEEYLKREE